jgi:hypothetical protein
MAHWLGCISLFLSISSVLPGTCFAQGLDYTDPDGSFALRPPEGWQRTRNPLSEVAWVTSFTKGAAAIEVVGFAYW